VLDLAEQRLGDAIDHAHAGATGDATEIDAPDLEAKRGQRGLDGRDQLGGRVARHRQEDPCAHDARAPPGA
jgi:hypothetical protein